MVRVDWGDDVQEVRAEAQRRKGKRGREWFFGIIYGAGGVLGLFFGFGSIPREELVAQVAVAGDEGGFVFGGLGGGVSEAGAADLAGEIGGFLDAD